MMQSTAAVFRIEWRRPATDQRVVAGIAVPWNETSYLTDDPKGERFLPGSLTRSIKARGDRLKLFRGGREHSQDNAIGRPVRFDARHAEGLWSEWRIAATPAGDAALEEIAEGMLDAFSIGFRPIRQRRGDDGAREVEEAEIHEVNILPLAAYDGARVLEVRAPAGAELPTPARDDLDAWLEAHPVPLVERAQLPVRR